MASLSDGRAPLRSSSREIPPGRSSSGFAAEAGDDGRFNADRRRVRRRRSDRCARRDRTVHAARSSATRGRSGWRTARRSACRMPRAARARPDVPAPAPRWSRDRRLRVRRPGSASDFGSTRVSGPGQNAAASRPRVVVELRERFARQRCRVTCAISGLNVGRPLAANSLATARSLRGVGAEAVNRLGRKRHEAARGERCRGLANGVRGRRHQPVVETGFVHSALDRRSP